MRVSVSNRSAAIAVLMAVCVVGLSTVSSRQNALAAELRGSMQGRPSDSIEVVAVVARYSAALASGDSTSALALLAHDALILESGGVETREEYRARHLPADIGFARAVSSRRTIVNVTVRGDAAWVSSTSTSSGAYRDRQIDSRGAELVVLSREPDGWKIRAIHWSSRSRPTR